MERQLVWLLLTAEDGAGVGPALAMAHGATSTRSSFEPQMERALVGRAVTLEWQLESQLD